MNDIKMRVLVQPHLESELKIFKNRRRYAGISGLADKPCCDVLNLLINDLECPLKYKPWTRDYILTVPSVYLKKNELAIGFRISHCPRCGSALPSSLLDEWCNILETNYGIDNFIGREAFAKIPPEFQTDKWWKKRGL